MRRTKPAREKGASAPRRSKPSKDERINGFDFTEPHVRFGRTGHIEEINPAAAELFDRSPLAMLGQPLSRYLVRHDADEFLHHLLRCRLLEKKVETDLHVKSGSGENIPIRLSSVCIATSTDRVRFRYQTTIVDLRETE